MIRPSHLRHNDGQRAYFESADQPTMVPTESAYSRRHFQSLIDGAGLRPDSRVLEIGAGMGRFTRMFDAAGFDIVASDISPGQVAALQRHFPNVEAFVADAEGLPDPVRPYDAVVGFFTLHHMPDLRAAFASFVRVLRPGGLIAFCEPNAFYVPFYLQVLLTPRMKWSVEKGIQNMRRAILEPAMADAGLVDPQFTHYGYFPPIIYNHTVGRQMDRLLDALPLPGPARAFQIVTARRARS